MEKEKGFFFHHEDGRHIPLKFHEGCYDVSYNKRIPKRVSIGQNQVLIYCCMKDIEAWVNREVNKKQLIQHILLTEYNNARQIRYIEIKFIYSLDRINFSIRFSLDLEFMDFGSILAVKSHASKVYWKTGTLFDAKNNLNRFTFGNNFICFFITGLFTGGTFFYLLFNDGHLDYALFALITSIALLGRFGYKVEKVNKCSQYINLLKDDKQIIFPEIQ